MIFRLMRSDRQFRGTTTASFKVCTEFQLKSSNIACVMSDIHSLTHSKLTLIPVSKTEWIFRQMRTKFSIDSKH